MRQHCRVRLPGLVPYEAAWQWQRHLQEAVRDGDQPHQLVLLQHPPVYTLGRRGRDEHMLVSEAFLAEQGAHVLHVDRGGDITFHGPGQLVAYPIIDLKRLWGNVDVVRYVRSLERAVIEALRTYGIESGCLPGRPGVWVGTDKIAAIGVRVSRGVTMHGFALNVSTDLRYFDYIIPCGIPDGGVTSMERLLGTAPSFDEVTARVIESLASFFDLEMAPYRAGAPSRLLRRQGCHRE